MSRRILTVGYEGRSSREVLTTIESQGVTLLADVRWRPASRKAGLSRSSLVASCPDYGLTYAHFRELGTPPDIMREFRATGIYAWDRYQEFLEKHVGAIEGLAERAVKGTVCLMCFEADANDCHRRLVAQAVSELTSVPVHHLPGPAIALRR